MCTAAEGASVVAVPQLTVEVLERVTGLPRNTLEEAVDRELFLSAHATRSTARAAI